MHIPRISMIAATCLALGACDQIPIANNKDVQPAAETAAAAVTDTSEVIATVNGTPITRNTFESYNQQRQQRRPGDAGNQDPQTVLDEIINLELALQDGIKLGIDKQPAIVSQVDQQRRAVIAGAAIKRQITDNPVTDEELKKIYEEKTAGTGKEYKARHILVEDEAKAKDLIAKLDGGADFPELAKEHSTGPSGKSGGDLGWFSAQQMVKPFSDAAAAMEKGKYSKEPVKTQFGWHVILLEDSRESAPPPFEQIKPQIQAFVQNEKIQNYVKQLREQASIDVTDAFMPKTESAPAEESAQEESAETETAVEETAQEETVPQAE